MAKKQHYRRKPRQNPVLPIAIGFFFIGLAIVMLASTKDKSSAGSGAPPGQFSRAPLAVNFPAPDLALENLDGKTESLADYETNVVLVNNWATWCPPCKAEMPVLEAYYEDHASKGFMIIAVEAGDSRDTVSEFAQNYGLQFRIWLDPNGASLKAFGNGNLPNSYISDRGGTVRYAWTGELDRATLDKYVTPLITE